MKILFLLFLNLLNASIFSLILNTMTFSKEVISAKKATSTIVVSSTITGSSNTKELEKITLQTKWFEQFQFAGYYMAQEKGYYRDEYLKLNILPYKDGINSTDEVVGGNAMYGVGDSSLVKDIIEGKNIVLLKAILQESPIIILSLAKNTFNNSKNKRIMVSKKESKGIVFQSILASHSIQLGYDLKPIYQSPKVSDLINDETDFIIAYKSNEPYLLEGYDIEDYHFINFDDTGLQFYSDILFTSKKEIVNYPDRVKRFTRATIKGWLWAFNNIEETAKFIYKNYNEHNKSLEALIFEGKELKALAFKKGTTFGQIREKSLKNIEISYKGRGMIENLKLKNNYHNYIYEPWYIKVKFKIEYYKYYIFSFILLLLISFIYWNYLLKKRVKEEVNRREFQEETLKKRNELLIDADKKIKMETYIAHASHQLKSPLNSITAIVNNLQREIDFSSKDSLILENKLTEIEKKSLLMTDTVNFFLKYLSNEHKKEYFSINQTIKESITSIDSFLKQDNVTIEFNYKEDFNIFGHEVQLIQVFHSIFENAIQALTVKKDNRLIKVSIDEDNNGKIVILIADNGKGISRRDSKKIFDPYFSTKKHLNVKGLGLHIAKIIIEEKFNGSISTYNSNGAVFKILLTPMKPSAE